MHSSAAISPVEATVASNGSPVTLVADSFNVQAGWRYMPVPEERIVLEKDQRLLCRITAPADEITLSGTLVFDAIGVSRAVVSGAAVFGPALS